MLKHETIRIQEDLIQYCRNGKDPGIPGITEGRLPYYRRLILNVVHGTINQAYPITRKGLSEKEWGYMLDRFFNEHDSRSPVLWRLPQEFYHFVSDSGLSEELKMPWLEELLWFEWLEIEVHMMPDHDHGTLVPHGRLFTDPLVINRESRLIRLEYPLHLYPVKEAEKMKGRFYVFIYREPESGTVKFINLSVLHAGLLEILLRDVPVSIHAALKILRSSLELPERAVLEDGIEPFLKEMISARAILGFRR